MPDRRRTFLSVALVLALFLAAHLLLPSSPVAPVHTFEVLPVRPMLSDIQLRASCEDSIEISQQKDENKFNADIRIIEDVIEKPKDGDKPSVLLRYFDPEKYLSDSLNPLLNNDCVPLRISLAELTTPICVYESKDDRYVSGSIRVSGTWEGPQMRSVERILAEDPAMEMLDIGCNIGCYTLMAAKLGHKVLAVDPLKQNLVLLSRSLRQGNIAENVTLLINAVSDRIETVTLHENLGNVGGTFVKPVAESNVTDDDHMASAILMDHLIPLIKNKTIIMKLDIESYEWHALKGGYKFFQEVNVKYLFMEWMNYTVNPETGRHIITFLRHFDMAPFTVGKSRESLDYANNATWPGDVLWVKQTFK